jgi:hypothetical protein
MIVPAGYTEALLITWVSLLCDVAGLTREHIGTCGSVGVNNRGLARWGI